MVGSGVPAAAIFCENLADADDAALMRLVISLKTALYPSELRLLDLIQRFENFFVYLKTIFLHKMFRLLITSLILLITMNSCDKTLATYSMKVEGKDIVITDVVYIMADGNDIDLLKCRRNEGNLERIGLPNSITACGCDVNKETIYNDNGEIIAKYCTDYYVVGCFLLEELLAYNPELPDRMKLYDDNAFAIIRDFTGTVTFTIKEEKYYRERLPILNIRGEGNINFHSDYEPGWEEDEEE